MSKATWVIIGLVALVGFALVLGKDHGADASSGACKMTVSADVLNIRDAPAASGQIIGKLDRGAQTDAETTVQDGYRELGTGRWASEQFLTPASGKC